MKRRIFFAQTFIMLFFVLLYSAGTASAFQKKDRSVKDPVQMVLVRGGHYVMGSDKGFPDEQPKHEVQLDAFYIDIHEVTVGQYQKYLKETGMPEPDFWFPDIGRLDEPVVGICWEEAAAYAAWAGKRLPTEAEWEYAARGGTAGLNFPWGNEPDLDYANLDSFGILSVASLKPNGYGLYDMIGNLWEWCSDWYDCDYYKNGPKINPQGPFEGKHKVLRGWAWNNRKRLAKITRRHKLFPGDKSYFVGFRCVKSARQKVISKDNELSNNKKGEPALPEYKPAEKQSITTPVEEADEGQKIKELAPKQVSKWAFVGKISKEHPTLLRVLMLHTNDMVKSLDIINKNSSKYSEKYLRFLPYGTSVYISKDNELSINKKGGPVSEEVETVNKKPDNNNETPPSEYKPAEKQSITAPAEAAHKGQK